jgi:UDP-glucose 4-epimerase
MAGYLRPEKVLITGGTGYLGARIGQFLMECGYQVSLGSREPFKSDDISGCHKVTTNWQDPELDFCKGYDCIIHTAGMNAKGCAESPEAAFYFNGICTEKLIEAAIKAGCKNFFYLSTVHIYDSPLVGCFSETSPVSNSHPYATSHFYGEQILVNALKKQEIKGGVLRLSNCFGSSVLGNGDNWELVLNQFVRDAVTKNEITITGNCLSQRDFLPISELVQVIERIFNYKGSIPNTINISSGVSITLEKAANLVADIVFTETGRKVSISKSQQPVDDGNLVIKNTALNTMGIHVSSDLTQEIRGLIRNLGS